MLEGSIKFHIYKKLKQQSVNRPWDLFHHFLWSCGSSPLFRPILASLDLTNSMTEHPCSGQKVPQTCVPLSGKISSVLSINGCLLFWHYIPGILCSIFTFAFHQCNLFYLLAYVTWMYNFQFLLSLSPSSFLSSCLAQLNHFSCL